MLPQRKNKINKALFIFGLILCLSPLVLNLISMSVHTSLISTYQNDEKKIGKDKLNQIYQDARAYNENLYEKHISSDYNQMLNYSSTHVMASIEIPVISLNIPIYHGTDDDILNNGVGHFSFSSLPVGGKNTHCLLTAHRGLPNSKLFTRIDELKKGDVIYIHVCDKKLMYEVQKSYVIDPEQIFDIKIQKNKDLLSLITCTPYGINTRRLVVQAKRVRDSGKNTKNTRFSYSLRESLFLMIPLVLAFIVIFRKKG